MTVAEDGALHSPADLKGGSQDFHHENFLSGRLKRNNRKVENEDVRKDHALLEMLGMQKMNARELTKAGTDANSGRRKRRQRS